MVMEQLVLPLPGLPAAIERTVPAHPADRIQRFHAKVHRTATCWWWLGAVADDGYGRYSFRDSAGRVRTTAAHIFAWQLSRPAGEPVEAGAVCMHECNIRLCVRIEAGHVALGTQRENIAYADLLGRRRGRRPVLDESPAQRSRREREAVLGVERSRTDARQAAGGTAPLQLGLFDVDLAVS